MRIIRWLIGLAALILFVVLDVTLPMPNPWLRFIFPILLSTALCLIRILVGPEPADRVVGIDILGILIIGFCGLMALFLKQDFFIDIAIAWALQSFIASIALAKFLEGRSFDE